MWKWWVGHDALTEEVPDGEELSADWKTIAAQDGCEGQALPLRDMPQAQP
jgi:hypothetical protein